MPCKNAQVITLLRDSRVEIRYRLLGEMEIDDRCYRALDPVDGKSGIAYFLFLYGGEDEPDLYRPLVGYELARIAALFKAEAAVANSCSPSSSVFSYDA